MLYDIQVGDARLHDDTQCTHDVCSADERRNKKAGMKRGAKGPVVASSTSSFSFSFLVFFTS